MFYLGVIDIYHFIASFSYTAYWFDICTCCKMLTTVNLANLHHLTQVPPGSILNHLEALVLNEGGCSGTVLTPPVLDFLITGRISISVTTWLHLSLGIHPLILLFFEMCQHLINLHLSHCKF